MNSQYLDAMENRVRAAGTLITLQINGVEVTMPPTARVTQSIRVKSCSHCGSQQTLTPEAEIDARRSETPNPGFRDARGGMYPSQELADYADRVRITADEARRWPEIMCKVLP